MAMKTTPHIPRIYMKISEQTHTTPHHAFHYDQQFHNSSTCVLTQRNKNSSRKRDIDIINIIPMCSCEYALLHASMDRDGAATTRRRRLSRKWLPRAQETAVAKAMEIGCSGDCRVAAGDLCDRLSPSADKLSPQIGKVLVIVVGSV